ncbi:hypothetical protein O181_095900 [Austropuccinia psidii MF-1]|uniref:Uncharacterized protein n=1 Tax=Austropuccinia psidii MF-1 TaxID=1389203 RepID=A0A9Q3J4Q7_9BASI|nr:hypothetical protein [Austropuccinia psidii MF-1]
MEINLLGSPYGISIHSPFMANWPYPSPVANMATSSSYGPFMAFMALHLNPEAIAAIYSQLGISVHFPQNQGEWPKWLFLAIWAHNGHSAQFCALRCKVSKRHFPTLWASFGSEPKSGQRPQKTQKHLSKL